MSLRYLAFLFPILLCVTAKKSFTLVIDTTFSMRNEIQVIKYHIGPVLHDIGNSSSLENYVVVPFNDPDVGPAQVFTSADKLIESIHALTESGGHDVPENSLSGLQMALQQSRPQSNIFLFTDACAKDEAKFGDIQELCRTTRSRVVIFMSGSCTSTNQFGRISLYYDVAKVCSGNVFLIEPAHLSQAFNFMREIAKDDYEDLPPWEPFTGSRELFFAIDSFTRDVVVAVNGRGPTLRLRHESGQSPRTERLIDTTHSLVYRIIEPRAGTYHSYVGCQGGETTVTVYKRTEFPFLIGFSPRYTISIRATSSRPLPDKENYILIVVPRSYDFRLKTLILHDMAADKQHSLNLVDIRLDSGIYTTSAFFEAQKPFRLTVIIRKYVINQWTSSIIIINETSNIYGYGYGNMAVNVDDGGINQVDWELSSKTLSNPFEILQNNVSGREANANEDFRITGRVMEAQIADTNSPWAAATVEIISPESPLTNYEQNATVACKVTGSPKPTIWWEDESGQQMTAESDILEYPSTHISYVTVPTLRANKTVSCRATTPNGDDSKSIELFVYRPYVFEMVQTPQDSTFEYESKGKLFCQVQAYPEAQIYWYHNNSRLVVTESNNEFEDDNNDNNNSNSDDENSDVSEVDEEELKSRFDYILENNALVINNMTTRLTGEYKCEVINEVKTESYTVTVNISGLEPPEVEVDNADITSNLGEDVEISCRVTKGKPNPAVTWWYKSVDSFDFEDIPEDIIVEEDRIKISDVKSIQKGVYKCLAANDQGQDSQEIMFKVHYAPKIEGEQSVTRRVFEEDKVELKCAVDADPKANVEWKQKQDDVFVPLGDRYIVDENNTLSFHALFNDSGTYTCTAENEAGKIEKIVVLDVLVRPYITPVPERMQARVGGSVVLPCTVHASPAVTIVWRFTALDSAYTSTELFRGDSLLSKELHLKNLTKANAGSYLCLVQNSVGSDRINIILDVV